MIYFYAQLTHIALIGCCDLRTLNRIDETKRNRVAAKLKGGWLRLLTQEMLILFS
jgi:hypothetical protein